MLRWAVHARGGAQVMTELRARIAHLEADQAARELAAQQRRDAEEAHLTQLRDRVEALDHAEWLVDVEARVPRPTLLVESVFD